MICTTIKGESLSFFTSMAKSRRLESLLAKLKQLKDPTSGEDLSQLQEILACKYALAVAQAAKMAGKYELTQLTADLVKAFHRFMVKPVQTDPSCLAKAALAEVLYQFNCREEAVFLAGIRHVQMEPVWGGQEDTAPKLRGVCALGLVRMNYPDVMMELGDLLADPEPPARIAAARAIAYSENEAGIPLLRLRSRVGDEPQVISECQAALLKLAPQKSLDFVARFLMDPSPQVQELVALVLGESRLPEAFPILQAWWKRKTDPELRQTGLLAIAMLRQDQPLQFLLSLLESGTQQEARDAIAALDLYRHDPQVWGQVQESIRSRDGLKETFRRN